MRRGLKLDDGASGALGIDSRARADLGEDESAAEQDREGEAPAFDLHSGLFGNLTKGDFVVMTNVGGFVSADREGELLPGFVAGVGVRLGF